MHTGNIQPFIRQVVDSFNIFINVNVVGFNGVSDSFGKKIFNNVVSDGISRCCVLFWKSKVEAVATNVSGFLYPGF